MTTNREALRNCAGHFKYEDQICSALGIDPDAEAEPKPYQAIAHDGRYVRCLPGTYMDTSPEEDTEREWARLNDLVRPSGFGVPIVTVSRFNVVSIHRSPNMDPRQVAWSQHVGEATDVATEIRLAIDQAFQAGVERGEELWS